ncbi:hypothetical protein [Duganella rivi]|nr:hypothetical protein [Duganella rivi]
MAIAFKMDGSSIIGRIGSAVVDADQTLRALVLAQTVRLAAIV